MFTIRLVEGDTTVELARRPTLAAAIRRAEDEIDGGFLHYRRSGAIQHKGTVGVLWRQEVTGGRVEIAREEGEA